MLKIHKDVAKDLAEELRGILKTLEGLQARGYTGARMAGRVDDSIEQEEASVCCAMGHVEEAIDCLENL